MTENTDLLVKCAALKGIEASIKLYMERIESLAVGYASLADEIEALKQQDPAGGA